jgi:RNA polymerase sigma factor (TIGR02999 family)
MSDKPEQITQFLQQWGAGDARALEQILPLIYDQLRAIAEGQMRRERPEHTLQATALVSELYLRLTAQHGGQWKDRGHFFAFAAMMMRRILKDYAKQSKAEKRGGSHLRVPLSDNLPWLGNSPEEILALNTALDALEQSDPRKARVLELRVLLGCTAEETAGVLEISKATADRQWTLAKAWLYREMTGRAGAADPEAESRA